MTVRPSDLGVTDKPVRLGPPADPRDNGHRLGEDRVESVSLASLEAFAAVDEPGAQALVGGEDAALIPEGGDVLIYGDGGAGKTTLSIDLACHLGAGKDWLGIPVPRRARVLLIENEGPRALFRRKLRRKLDGWTGPTLDGHISVVQHPWSEFTFADATWRHALAATIAENEIDVLIVGPVTRSGMNVAGTLQEVRDFIALVGEVRAASGRRLTVILIHHENKGGTVSGAWEGSGDTLIHVQARGNGYTHLHIEKARWSSTHHKATFELAWTAGEGFALKDERDLAVEPADRHPDPPREQGRHSLRGMGGLRRHADTRSSARQRLHPPAHREGALVKHAPQGHLRAGVDRRRGVRAQGRTRPGGRDRRTAG